MQTWWQAAPPGAMCVFHPSTPAGASCPRCGNFVCEECGRGGIPLCPTCRLRAAAPRFPFTAENWTLGGVLEFSWEAFKRDWLMLSVAALITLAVLGTVTGIGAMIQLATATLGPKAALVAQVVITAFNTLITGVMTMGLIRVAAGVLDGGKTDIALLFSAFQRIGAFLASGFASLLMLSLPAGVIAYLFTRSFVQTPAARGAMPKFDPAFLWPTAIASLLMIPWGLWVVLPVYLAQAEVALTRTGGLTALGNCFQMVRGERLRLFAIYLIGFLVTLAGFCACLVGILPAMALFQLMITAGYLCVRNRNGLNPDR